MKSIIKNFLISIVILCCFSLCSYSSDATQWHNDLRTKFLNNEAVIMEINIRSFNSNDKDGDGFVDETHEYDENGKLISKSIDEDDDGKVDVIHTYGQDAEGNSTHSVTHNIYDEETGELVRKEVDEDGDGDIDVIYDKDDNEHMNL